LTVVACESAAAGDAGQDRGERKTADDERFHIGSFQGLKQENC
jgi:hypothetical protein